MKKIFRERINALSEEIKLFVFGNRHHEPGNCRPILEAGYLVVKNAEVVAKKLSIIRMGNQKTNSVSASEPSETLTEVA